MQDNAADAIRKGDATAVDYLRKAIALEPENTKTQKLLAQMINDQHSEAETLLTAGNLDEASTAIEHCRPPHHRIHPDRQPETPSQPRNPSRTGQAQTSTDTGCRRHWNGNGNTTATTTNATTSSDDTNDTTQYLERAQRAISYGNLSSGDDRSESAVSYLSSLLEKTPDHPEALKLLEKVVTLQQDNAVSLLRKRDTEKARTSLDESQR